MTVGERIKLRRRELGLTQTELAERMGLTSKTTICKAETKDFNPTTDRVKEFAKALGVTPAYLMGWENDKEKKQVIIERVMTSSTSSYTGERDDIKELVEVARKSSPDNVRIATKMLKGLNNNVYESVPETDVLTIDVNELDKNLLMRKGAVPGSKKVVIKKSNSKIG